ncbi:MAG: Type II secretion system protein D precursor [Betaproteobacteria bacterium ADurb.Bin341]|nr:MAG: Type II secretion system protein D precursor [Betaproteobacteria bacterium ADurb.Bin341]
MIATPRHFFPHLLSSGLIGLALALAGCASAPPPISDKHLEPAPRVMGKAPEFASVPPLPLPPKPSARPEVYSVVVHNVNVQELLFALARDAKMNVDLHPGITGTVSMNVLDQTLPEILDRIARQVDMRYEIEGKNLAVMPDAPFLKTYRIDYPNIARNIQTSISTSTNVASTGGGPGASSGGGGGSNASTTTIANTANNRFWETLVSNVKDLLRETDKVLPEGSSETFTEQTAQQTAAPQPGTTAATTTSSNRSRTTTPLPAQLNQQANTVVRRTTYREAASVIANPENGIITVRATHRQHEKVREFIDRILGSARRQVLIEATIAEVDLSDRYQQGIDWSILRSASAGSTAGSGIVLSPVGPSTGLNTGGLVSTLATIGWSKTGFRGNTNISAVLALLESFGTLRVLSSPKISVLNNQTSVLKVVDNEVYFTIEVTPGTVATATTPGTPATYTTTINTVPIGFLMTVTPQISDNGEVILNLRPTISRIKGYANDPNPELANYSISNRIPVVQTREMESIMRVQSGDIAILGGLMQDTRDFKTDEVPGLNRIPLLGELFKYKDNLSRKSELVVFLRPIVLGDASLDGDFRAYRHLLPEAKKAMDAPIEPTVPGAPRPKN